MPYRRLISPLFIAVALFLAGCDEPTRPTVNLYRAVQLGDLDQIKRHLYWRTDINQPDPDGNYPLHVAVAQGQVPLARLLLRHGADIQALDAAGRTPLHVALARGKITSARLLLDRGADDDLQALLYALVDAGTIDRDALDWLVSQRVELDAPGPDGRPALHRAVMADDVRLVKRLIIAGVDVNRPDGSGQRALTLATAANDAAMIALLTQYGAER